MHFCIDVAVVNLIQKRFFKLGNNCGKSCSNYTATLRTKLTFFNSDVTFCKSCFYKKPKQPRWNKCMPKTLYI